MQTVLCFPHQGVEVSQVELMKKLNAAACYPPVPQAWAPVLVGEERVGMVQRLWTCFRVSC